MRLASAAFGILCLLPLRAQDTVPRHHTEEIRSSRQEYRLNMGGVLDGTNTKDPVFSVAWKQSFQPMQSVRIENIGDTDIVNPWVLVNGRRNWRTAADILDAALRTYGDPREMTPAEKARAIYEFARANRFHATTGDLEVKDPVKMFNVYGFALCGDNAPVLMDLWRLAGFKVRRGFPEGHCVSEVWYDRSWHLLDADEALVFLDRDNATVSGDQDVARDHDLVKRTTGDEGGAALFAYDGDRSGEYASHIEHTMALKLRPGESLEWRWDHSGKHHQATNPMYSFKSTNLHDWGDDAWKLLANGKWIYAPPLRKPAARSGVTAADVRWMEDPGRPAVAPAKPGVPASLIWKMDAPYAIVGGTLRAKLRCKPGSTCAFQISDDARNWREVLATSQDGMTGEMSVNLDSFFPNIGPARYSYFLRAGMISKSESASAGLDAVVIENDLQMAPLSLPALELGDNTVRWTDETSGAHAARVTFNWVERSSPRPPAAPAIAEFPSDGSEVEGTQIAFRWKPAEAPGGKIVEYHFQLSDSPSLRWTLSTAFDAVIPSADGTAAFKLDRSGLLNPGKKYFWRVRAKSESGVWSPWSSIWSFIPQGPGVPLKLRLEKIGDGTCALAWDANPRGRKPAGYLVYASNEKGFSVSDEPYRVYVGNQKVRGLFPGQENATFPANLLMKTPQPQVTIEPVYAFYRVVAVDSAGVRSGPTDYVAAPRPLIYSKPVLDARVGVPYRYEAKTIASIGDLGFRTFLEESYQSAFWTPDKPRFSIVSELSKCGIYDAAWLKIDPRTGVLSGVPKSQHIGEYQINVLVEIDGAGTAVQSFTLRVRP